MGEHPHRHAVTAGEFMRMGEAGVFGPEVRLELIEGEIIEMAPIGPPHASVTAVLHELLVRRAADRAFVWNQSSMVLGERSMPQPDIALLEPRSDRYFTSHPRPRDVLLVVEVAESSLAFDRGTKARLYAACGIPEYWIVDVNERAIHVHREPAEGAYRALAVARGDDRIEPLTLPGIGITVRELFPAA